MIRALRYVRDEIFVGIAYDKEIGRNNEYTKH
jgi:hypothetical protein